MEKFKNSTG
jgi:transposase